MSGLRLRIRGTGGMETGTGCRNRFWNPASGIARNVIRSYRFLPYEFDLGMNDNYCLLLGETMDPYLIVSNETERFSIPLSFDGKENFLSLFLSQMKT